MISNFAPYLFFFGLSIYGTLMWAFRSKVNAIFTGTYFHIYDFFKIKIETQTHKPVPLKRWVEGY